MVSWSSPKGGCVLSVPNLLSSTRVRLSCAECADFIFCATGSSSGLVASVVSSVVLSASASLLLGANPMLPVACACIPVIVPMTINRITDSAVLSLLSEDAKNFVKGITYVSMGQGTLAMMDFMFGDLLAGFMKGIFAAMGFYVSQMDDGVSVIPSFTVVSFVNGCITMLSALERMSARHTPLFSGVMPLYLNYIHLSQLVHPILCFAGAYMGWQIIKELRRTGGLAQSAPVQSLFPSTVSSGITQQPQVRPRLLSAGSSSGTIGFQPFTGRGHSLSAAQPAAEEAS